MKHLSTLLVLHGLAAFCLAKDLNLNVDLKRPIAVTDDKFLSLTVDPALLLAGSALSTDYERSVNLAKALAPAYVRLEGPNNTLRCFSGQSSSNNPRNRKNDLSESDLVVSHRWAKKAGLRVIACISPGRQAEMGEESESPRDIISFSDDAKLDMDWQLGCEWPSRCNLTADEFARQTLNLRKILDEFPRYTKSIVIGPDVVARASQEQLDYLEEYLKIASPALSAIPWHPDLAGVSLDDHGAFVHRDNLEKDKRKLIRALGRFVTDRPLWIAETKQEEEKNSYIGALVLARSLGTAANLNVNVLMRQPASLTQPTPDYWVSVLYKNLVGPEVFSTKLDTVNDKHIYIYCQCTKVSSRYKKGSITIFGANMGPESVAINFRGTKVATVHQYLLEPGADAANRMFAETVLLNNQTLTVINNTIPDIDPVTLDVQNGDSLGLPSAGIGFWVFPDLRIKSCIKDDGLSGAERLSSSTENPATIQSQERRANAKVEQKWSRSKRSLSEKIVESSTLKREKKRVRNSDDIERKVDRKMSQKMVGTKGVKSKLVGQGGSSNGENTFYGLSTMEPSNGFPRDDQLFLVEDPSRREKYAYGKDNEPRNRRMEGYGQTRPAKLGQDDADYVWVEQKNHYPLHEAAKFIGRSRMLNDPAEESSSKSELWDAQSYRSKRNDRFGNEQDFGIVGILSGRNRKIYSDQNKWGTLSDYYGPGTLPPTVQKASNRGFNSHPRKLDLSIASDSEKIARFKRESTNLPAALDQEMINEDEANLRDCNCRVTRRLKNHDPRPEKILSESEEPTSEEKATVDSSTEEDTASTPDGEVVEFLSDSGPAGNIEGIQIVTPSTKLKKNPATFSRTRTYSKGSRTSPVPESSLEFPGNYKDINVEASPASTITDLPSEDSTEEDTSKQSSESPTESTFFRTGQENKQEEKATRNSGNYTTDDEEISTPFVDKKVRQENKKTGQTKVLRTKNSCAVINPDTLSHEAISGKSENNYDCDNAAGASRKREAAKQQVSLKIPVNVTTASPTSSDLVKKRSKGKANIPKKKSSTAKPQDSQALERIKALRALRELFQSYREKRTSSPPKMRGIKRSKSSSKPRKQRTRKWKDRPHERRRSRENIPDVEDSQKDDSKRNMKRRAAPGKIEDSDDSGHPVDSEKLDPMKDGAASDSKTEKGKSDKLLEKIDAPTTELVKARNIRKRIFNPKSREQYLDSTVMGPCSVKKMKRKLRLENLRAANLQADDNEEYKTYLAMVENLERPRILYFQERQENEGAISDEQVLSPSSYIYNTAHRYDQPLHQPTCTCHANNLKAAEYSTQEESSENSESEEIYIVDPSEYRGGKPPLHLYRSPLMPMKNVVRSPNNAYEIIWEPIAYRALTTRQTEPYISDDETSIEKYDELPKSAKELLKILIEDLDPEATMDLSMQDEEISEEYITESEEERIKQISESKESSDSSESVEIICVQNIREQRGIVNTNTTTEEETETERNSTTSETLVTPEFSSSNDSVEVTSQKMEEEHFRKRRDTEVYNNTERVQPQELQHLDEPSTPSTPTIHPIDDVDKSLIQKIPLEKYKTRENINKRKNIKKVDYSLPFFIGKGIPKLGDVVVEGLKKAENFTGSVEELIENIDERSMNSTDAKSDTASQSIFRNAIMNVQKFFMLLSGVNRLIRT